MKLITFAVPCYNSAEYMDKCINTLLSAGEDAEILIINDGSAKDNTAQIADDYAQRYPTVCRAIHKENGGHGDAVYTGIINATGLYFKVVDSDDWLDEAALAKVLDAIKAANEKNDLPDLILTNYVYERVHEGKRHTNSFKNYLPADRIFTWDEMKELNQSHYLTMHTLTYRTQILLDSGITFPKHTFYVDNIFAYVPLSLVEKLYYVDCDMYRYYIGRGDQSVNESVMLGRLDQQLRVNRIMIDAKKPGEAKSKAARTYIMHYLMSIMMVSSIFCILAGKEGFVKKDEIWAHLKETDPDVYRVLSRTFIGRALRTRTAIGRFFCVAVYRAARRIYKFN